MLLVWHVRSENVKPLLTLEGRHYLSQSGELENWERTDLETWIMISDHLFSCQISYKLVMKEGCDNCYLMKSRFLQGGMQHFLHIHGNKT